MKINNSQLLGRRLYKWIVASGLIIGLLFLVDLLFVKDTILTPYQEFHPCSKPIRDERAGITYRVDLKTGKAYAVDEKGNLAAFDKEKGTLTPLGVERKNWIAVPEGLIYNHPPISPLYAFFIPAFSFKILLPLFFVILFLFIFHRLKQSTLAQRTSTILLFLFISAILIRASFAWVRHGFAEMGTEFLVYENEDMIFDVPKIGNVFDFLQHYPEKMPTLSLHGSHFPPGYVLLLKGIASLGGYSDIASIKAHVGFFGWFILILGSTVVIPLYLVTRRLFDSEMAFLACVIFTLVPNSMIFGAVSMDALFAASALWPVWFLLKAMDHKRSIFYSFLAGILLTISTFLSFSGLVVGLFMLLLIVLRLKASKEKFLEVVRLVCFTALGFAALAFFIYVVFGFNFLATFLRARELEARLMSDVAALFHRKSASQLWLYTSWGNLLAFAIYTGFPLIGIWIRGVYRGISTGLREMKTSMSFLLATFVFVFIIGVTGIYHMETERIWLFVTAFVVIASVGEFFKVRSQTFQMKFLYPICALLVVQTVLFESLLFTIW